MTDGSFRILVSALRILEPVVDDDGLSASVEADRSLVVDALRDGPDDLVSELTRAGFADADGRQGWAGLVEALEACGDVDLAFVLLDVVTEFG